jgi:CubicO group peptidase (beta-lactamase class C family)
MLTLLLTACATTNVEQKAAAQPFPPDRRAALDRELALDDPVSKYVTWVPDSHSRGNNITLRTLANMTAGLTSYTEDEAFVKALYANWNRVFTPRELVEVGLKLKPTFPPGTGWHYSNSNTNTVLLGIILEQVGGKPLPQHYAEKIFQPLRLAQTSYPTTAALPAPYAHGITEQTLDGKQADATCSTRAGPRPPARWSPPSTTSRSGCRRTRPVRCSRRRCRGNISRG